MAGAGGGAGMDPQLAHFMEAESQKQRFQHLVHTLTDECWELCVGTPGQKLDRKTESCIVNCVDRFLDTSTYVVNRLEKEGQQIHNARARAAGGGEEFKWN